MTQKTALVIGAGAFGTAIASVLAHNFEKVVLKVRSEDVYTPIKENDENAVYLPGLKLPSHLTPALTWKEVDELVDGDIGVIVSGLPTAAIAKYYHENFDRFTKYLDQGIPVVSLSKGIDPVTLEMADDLFYEIWPHHKDNFVFLSGPSFAKEIVQAQITLVTIAGRSRKVLKQVSSYLEAPYFKALPSYDVKGVCLGGALKNVLAIAGGVIEGLGYNDNTRAAMITRGIAEMLRFGRVFNARPETFYGLSGMGDLILTTTGGLSRNKQFGLELAKGRSPEEIINSQRTTVEGYKTTKAVHLLSEKYEIRANIFNAAYEVLFNGKKPKEVIERLMAEPSRFELE